MGNICSSQITVNGRVPTVSAAVWLFEYPDDMISQHVTVASKEHESPLPVQNKQLQLETVPEFELTTDQQILKTKKGVQDKSPALETIPELEPAMDQHSLKTKKPESALLVQSKLPKLVTFPQFEPTTEQTSPRTKKPEPHVSFQNKQPELATIPELELRTSTVSTLSSEEPRGSPTSQEKHTALPPALETIKLRHLKRVSSAIPWVGSVLQTKTGDFNDFYTCGRQLGAGEFGRTFLCVEKETGKEYAVKSIEKSNIISDVDAEYVRREIQIMHHLAGQPNMISIKEAYEDADEVCVVMELCEGGDLSEAILWGRHYGDRKAAKLTRKIVEAVETCHLLGVIHRDIKLDNFLFVNWEDDAPLKIIDFGLSVFFKPGDRLIDVAGTPCYVAPEVFLKKYGPEADIWSAGVILYFLLSGRLPFSGDSEEEVGRKVVHDDLDFSSDPWPSISEGAKDLVRRMLDKDPSTRISAPKILSHPWVQLGYEVLSLSKQSSEISSYKKEATRIIAQSLSENEIADLKERFKMMDTYKRGKLTYKTITDELERFGENLEEGLDFAVLRPMVQKIHNRATISYGEFLASAMHLKNKLR
ncbi:calcium-dependent protein kinase 2-like [Humulus lupulus]|uniref:calcium-dependent protein kinase 2-like n=1 Tax=Humulus lupulus TaxID=3486 RepID=UPI002B410FB5|nr:calcium-dependent protein kinase 2-like [Humulus lupulus]